MTGPRQDYRVRTVDSDKRVRERESCETITVIIMCTLYTG